MALWLLWLAGGIAPPSRFAPVDWHVHELLWGWLGAILSGFLLTAIPNWTGRLPVMCAPLAGLVGHWLLGRAAVLLSDAGRRHANLARWRHEALQRRRARPVRRRRMARGPW